VSQRRRRCAGQEFPLDGRTRRGQCVPDRNESRVPLVVALLGGGTDIGVEHDDAEESGAIPQRWIPLGAQERRLWRDRRPASPAEIRLSYQTAARAPSDEAKYGISCTPPSAVRPQRRRRADGTAHRQNAPNEHGGLLEAHREEWLHGFGEGDLVEEVAKIAQENSERTAALRVRSGDGSASRDGSANRTRRSGIVGRRILAMEVTAFTALEKAAQSTMDRARLASLRIAKYRFVAT
jgi:hypothetical protein